MTDANGGDTGWALERTLREHAHEDDDDSAVPANDDFETIYAALQGPAEGQDDDRPDVPEPRFPRVTSINPERAVPGEAVLLRGENLDLVRRVSIGGVRIDALTLIDRERLEVVVPLGISTGEVRYSDRPDDPIELTLDDQVKPMRREES